MGGWMSIFLIHVDSSGIRVSEYDTWGRLVCEEEPAEPALELAKLGRVRISKYFFGGGVLIVAESE